MESCIHFAVLAQERKRMVLLEEEAKSKPIRERQRIVVFMEVDELGLDPYEFRVYGHIARRGSCFSTLDKVAATCCMSVRKVQYALKVLHAANLIHKEERKGRPSTFKLTKPSNWLGKINSKKLAAIREAVKLGQTQRLARLKMDSVNLDKEKSVDPEEVTYFLDNVPH